MKITESMFAEGIEYDSNSVIITDDAGIIWYVNKKFQEITGYTSQEVIGKHTRILKSGETPDYIYKDLWETITNGHVWKGRFHNKKKNGVFFWEDITITPLFSDDKSKIIGFIAIKVDISDRIHALESLEERNKFVERVTSTNPNVIYIFDILLQKYIYVNEQIYNLIGYHSEEMLSFGEKVIPKIIHPQDLNKINNYYEGIKKQVNGRIYEIEYRIMHKNGSYKWTLSRDSIFEFENKKPKLIVGTTIDITDRKLYEQNLEESNTTKDKLFSIISHDLKNPFSAIIGYSGFLQSEIETLSKEEIKDFSYNIFSISKQINTLLTNLLDWSKLQTGKIYPSYIKINLCDFINYTFNMLKISSDSKQIELVNTVDKNINIYVDEKMMYSILYNLIHNSIKFTPKNGNVIVSATKGNFTDPDRICISVSDNGIGMTYDNMGKLFTLTDQYTTIGTDNEKGSGLGLLIVKEFVEKMGGKIEVKSEKNKGTEFIFDVELYDL